MALLGNGSSDNIVSGTISAPIRWSFSFHYRNAAAPGGVAADIPFEIASTTISVGGFAWDHTSVTFQQAIFQRQSGGTFAAAKFTTSLQANTWYAIGGRYDGANITAWLNGELETSSTASDPDAPANTKISLLAGLAAISAFDDGQIAFACLWNTNLSDAEMAALGKGYHPLLIRPSAIIEGSDLTRGVNPYRNTGWTLTGATVQPNPRIVTPRCAS